MVSVYNNTSFTWSHTHRRCLQLASSLSSLGVLRGHVVSVVAPNIPAMYELHFAVPFAGAVLNINLRLDARTISVMCSGEMVEGMNKGRWGWRTVSLLPAKMKKKMGRGGEGREKVWGG